MGYRAGASFARYWLKLEEFANHISVENTVFLRLFGGHPGAPRGAKVGTSYNPIDQNYCAAILVKLKE
jgi:hypothetical protein